MNRCTLVNGLRLQLGAVVASSWFIDELRIAHGPQLIPMSARSGTYKQLQHTAAELRHLNFPEAGHVLFPFEASGQTDVAASMPLDLGGRAGAAITAHASAWPEVLRHLKSGAAAGTAGA